MNMRKSSALALSVLMGALLLAFQNCSNQTGFTSTGELVSKAATDTSGSNDTVPGAIADPTPIIQPPATGGGRTIGGGTDRDDDDDRDNDHDEGHGNHTHPGAKGPCPDHSHTATTATALRFVCVLRGNGKSERIGLNGGTLAGQVGTPRDVCMSENACLKILSSKFDVQSAEPRGFCSNLSAHVVSMTDLEIQSALAQAELKQAMATSH
ncbi:hypothetical protein BH10BDE1_BH10BDE1_34910 [soil metagenome]